jgi:hypothetical protein
MCKKNGHESALIVGKGSLGNCIHESTLEMEEVMMDCEVYAVHG